MTISLLVPAIGSTLLVIGAACGTSGTGTPKAPGGDASTSQSYGASACGTCVAQACAAAIQTCEGDPQCALYLSCIDACAAADGGDVSASCAAACPLPNESTGQGAQQAFATCRAESSALCAACGAAPSEDGGEDAAPEAAAEASSAEGGALDGGVDGSANACRTADASACAACDEANCCPELSACENSSACLTYFNCRDTCAKTLKGSPLEGCWYGCDQKYPAGFQIFAAFNACVQISCSAPAACNESCGECAVTKCATQYAECYENVDCFASIDCILSCSGADAGGCQTACVSAHPDAGALLDNYEACYGSQCPSVCNTAQVRRAPW